MHAKINLFIKSIADTLLQPPLHTSVWLLQIVIYKLIYSLKAIY